MARSLRRVLRNPVAVQTCYAVVISALKACSFLCSCSLRRPRSLCPFSAMAQQSGDVHQNPGVREINSFQEASFGTGPSGDVPPPGPGPAVPRPRSTTTRGRHDRRSSNAAPHPWRGIHPSASEEDCRRIDGARRALRYLFDVTQDHLEQALREELSNAQLCYLSHCMASMWEDSDDESSRASSLDTPDLAEHEQRAGRTRREPSSRGGQNCNNFGPGRECEVLAPAVPPQDYDDGGRTPRLQEQYDRIGNIWRWPTICVLARICLKHISRMIHVYIVACGLEACGAKATFCDPPSTPFSWHFILHKGG